MQTRLAGLFAGGAAVLVAVVVAVVILSRDDGPSDSPAETAIERGNVAQRGTPPPPREGPHVEAVVSAHELATQAGITTLERGGTAADAAIAVAATLSVVEPWFSSVLGGGTWALYYEAATNTVTSLNGVGPTGSNATIEDYEARAGEGGIHQSNVPGAWDGWMLWLEAYGALDLAEVLEPAMSVAREGFPVSPQMADWLRRSAISARPDTAAIYAPDGVVLTEGETVYQVDLADTFEALATAYQGALPDGRTAAVQAARDYYYRGPLADAIVAFSDEFGGYLTLDDFAGFEAEIMEPISIDWDDEITVYQNPPNSQGITMLMALNTLKGFDFSEFDGAQDPGALHLQVEALKLAFADRNLFVGDPERVDIPVERLLSDAHAVEQRARISMETAQEWPIGAAPSFSNPLDEKIGNTTTFHIVDKDGNAAAVTTSLGAQFLVVGDTGINMNNRMRFLALEDGDPNQLTPGFTVRHTSNPYMAFRNGRLYILGGNTGVDTQPQVQLQQFINIVEFGFGAQEAVSAPRFVDNSFPESTYPYQVTNTLDLQSGFPDETVEELERLGHDISVGSGTFGTGEVLLIEQDGRGAEYGADEGNDTSSGMVLPLSNE